MVVTHDFTQDSHTHSKVTKDTTIDYNIKTYSSPYMVTQDFATHDEEHTIRQIKLRDEK